MPKTRTEKVVCYIVRDCRIVTFTHDAVPLEETGVQVPAGTIRPAETPEQAALREAREETGLGDLRVVRSLGAAEYDISPYRHEIMRRHFFELTTDTPVGGPWRAGEPDPEHPDRGHPDPEHPGLVHPSPQHSTDGPTWTCRWTPLEQAHVLSGGLSAMIGLLIPDES